LLQPLFFDKTLHVLESHILPSKNMFIGTPLNRFRFIALAEGISYLVLLFIAMPLKYYFNIAEIVKYTGWIHGLLFILYAVTLIPLRFSNQWGFGRLVYAMFLSFVPFGTFILDKKIKQELQS